MTRKKKLYILLVILPSITTYCIAFYIAYLVLEQSALVSEVFSLIAVLALFYKMVVVWKKKVV